MRIIIIIRAAIVPKPRVCRTAYLLDLYFTMGSDDRVAYAIIFPTYHAGSEGIVAACCTKRANLMQRDHKRGSIAIIDTPAWLYYDCYFFPGMTLLNWSGMTDATYNRCLHIGLLGDYLNAQLQSHGIVELKDAYCVATRGEPYFKGLRDLLGRLGVQVWLELVSRCSVRVCGALDASVRMFAGTYVESQESQYLLWQRCVPKAPAAAYSEPWVPQPWDWYQFPVWQSMGQQPVTEYIAACENDEDRIAMEVVLAECAYDEYIAKNET